MYEHPDAVLCSSTPNRTASCCSRGDFCLSENLCSLSYQRDGASGIYLAHCTDPTFPSPACRKECGEHRPSINNNQPEGVCAGSLPVPDIVFDTRTGIWSCCSGYSDPANIPQCSKPTNVTVRADPPAELHTLSFSSRSTATMPLASPHITNSSSPTMTPSLATLVFATPSSDSTALPQTPSVGTEVTDRNGVMGIGIGIGAGIAGILLGLAFFALIRRCRHGGSFKRSTTPCPIPEVPATEHRAELRDSAQLFEMGNMRGSSSTFEIRD